MFLYFIRFVCTALLAFSFSSERAFGLQIPQKYSDISLKQKSDTELQFQQSFIDSQEFVHIKHKEWQACHQNSAYFLSGDNNSVFAFIGHKAPVDNLQQMEQNKLQNGKVEITPWSGDFWAYAKGILGNRYLNPEFAGLFDWQTRYQFVQNTPAQTILQSMGQNGISTLSTSEKYDLIIGDSSFNLTDTMWAEGKKYYDESGTVEGWMGICHGWAPAAIIEPRPRHSIDVTSLDQKWQVHLLPSEIKGLVSYSWASNNYHSLSIGQRCNKKNPSRDENGRLTDPECFDLNPSTWHLAIVNQLGRFSRSFVMDATYDYEVWNQPVSEYSYSYFNVKTNKSTTDLSKALVERSQFTNDKFQKYRSKEAKYLVGITMKVGYVVETSASNQEQDSPEHDVVRWVAYEYDLEINAAGKIIGGEWHQTAHPDFIWTPSLDAKPNSPLDDGLSISDWQDEYRTIPLVWAKAAQRSSQQGYILNTLVRALLEKSNH